MNADCGIVGAEMRAIPITEKKIQHRFQGKPTAERLGMAFISTLLAVLSL